MTRFWLWFAVVFTACGGLTGQHTAVADPVGEDGTRPPPTFAEVTAPPPTFSPVETSTLPNLEPPVGGTDTVIPPPAPTMPTERPPVAAEPVAYLIDRLRTQPEGSRAGYDRGLFEHWVDEDVNGCDTRCEIFAAERRSDLPGLPGGGWLSPYDGYATDDPSELEIDHVVALAEAWDSGASGWDAGRRRAFANDIDEPAVLVAVTAAANRSKSDHDPAEWQPPSTAAWCEFVTSWVRVKLRWDLTADEAEIRALRNMATSQSC